MARTRQRGDPLETYTYSRSSRATIWRCRSNLPPPEPEGPFTDTQLPLRNYQITTDELTPEYLKKRRTGEALPVNPFSTEKWFSQGLADYFAQFQGVAITSAQCSGAQRGYHTVNAHLLGAPSSNLPGPPDFPSEGGIVTDAVADFRTRFWDIGTFIAEFSKTVSLVTGALQRVTGRVDDIERALSSKGLKRGTQAFADAFESSWLEARYGWRVLYYDLLSAQQAINDLVNSKVLMRGAAQSVVDSSTAHTPWVAHGSTSFGFRTRWKYTTNVSRRGFCIGYHDASIPVHIDPVVTAWELVRYSFVIDWFVNIGSILAAFSPFSRGEVVGSGWTARIERVYTLETELFSNGDQQPIDVSFSFETVPPTIVLSKIRRLPAEASAELQGRVKFNVAKAVDLAALVYQAVRRNPNRVFNRR